MYNISLRSNNKVIWEVNSNNDDFVDGFSYGMLFMLTDEEEVIAQRYMVVVRPPVGEELYIFHDLDSLRGSTEFIYPSHITLYNINDYEEGHYVVGLRDPTDDNEANIVLAKSTAFFQGLFTVLNALKIPYDHVVLHKPIKDDETYRIEGLQLLSLKDFLEQELQRIVQDR